MNIEMQNLKELMKGCPYNVKELAEPFNKENHYGYCIKTTELEFYDGKYIICKCKNFFGITAYQKFKLNKNYSKIENHWNFVQEFLYNNVFDQIMLKTEVDSDGDTYQDFIEWHIHGQFDKMILPTMETPEKTGYYFTD